jgi:SAM-dependent methyltransferase
VRRALGERAPGAALDVACGTGLSLRALVELGATAVGVDAAPAMVAIAAAAAPVAVAEATALPFPAGVFDLVTVGSGVHWFGPGFAAEAARVLRPGGALLLYEHAGPDAPGLRDWFRHRYLPRYPPPPRGRLAAETDPGPAFTPVRADRWPDPIPFDRDAFADYLMTQSNVLAAAEPPAATRAWLRTHLPPIFPTPVTFTASYQLLRLDRAAGGGEAPAGG